MSDDAGKITLKISRSPSESVPRYRQMSSDVSFIAKNLNFYLVPLLDPRFFENHF